MVAMPPERRTEPSYMRGGVVACLKRRHACPGCAPLTDGAAAGTWRVEADASGLHGGDLAVGLARMLLPGVLMGGPNTIGWCCGMSEEAARVSGAWPPSRTAPPPAPGGGKLPHRVYTEWI